MGIEKRSFLKIYTLAVIVRYFLINSEYHECILDSVEVSTPLNSWKRVREAVYLHNLEIYPYSGDYLHVPPLHLAVYNAFVKLFGNHLCLIFIAADLITSVLLYYTVKNYMQSIKEIQSANVQKYAENGRVVMLTEYDFNSTPYYVALTYLFNPYCILNCVGFATTVFSNLFLALFLLGITKGNLLICATSLVICISENFYPVFLISPLFMYYYNVQNSKRKAYFAVATVVILWTILIYASYLVYGNLDFLECTYEFILTVPDLTPNIGLFWYFFIEMFEHFRLLFIYAFQLNVSLLYFIPLSVRFRKDPVVLTAGLLALFATFKSYPSIGDVGFVIALLVCWKHLISYYQQGFIVACCFFITTALAPLVWFLWIYSGSANANFYFGATLAFATAEIFLITDILFAYIKREFTLSFGYIEGGDSTVLFLLE